MAVVRGPDTFPSSVPDTLQDICVFYCMNHLEVLSVTSPEDQYSVTALLPQPVKEKMLNYLLNCCLPNGETSHDEKYPWKQTYDFLRSASVTSFSKLCLHRKNLLSRLQTDISVLFKNCIFTDLDLLCCNLGIKIDAFQNLVRKNLPNLRHLRLKVLEQCENGMLSRNSVNRRHHHADFAKHKHNLRHFLSDVSSDTDSSGNAKESFEDMDQSGPVGSPSSSKAYVEETRRALYDHKFLGVCTICIGRNSESLSPCYMASESPLEKELKTNTVPARELQTLSLTDFSISGVDSLCLQSLLNSTTHLTSLALVYCRDMQEEMFQTIRNLTQLRSLVLSDTLVHNNGWEFTCFTSLTNLRHLDVSVSSFLPKKFLKSAGPRIIELINSLPRLISLDVSGTNLPKFFLTGGESCPESCQYEFKERRFEFLGLFNCSGLPCQHTCLPVNQISGSSTEEQIIVALHTHLHNERLMPYIIEVLYDSPDTLASQKNLKNQCALLEGLLAFLETYPEGMKKAMSKTILCLYKVLKNAAVRQRLTVIQRRRLLQRFHVFISYCMGNSVAEMDVNSTQLIRYSCRITLILMNLLKLPEDAIYCHMFEHHVHCMVSVIKEEGDDSLCMQALRHLHFACRASQEHKKLAGTSLGLTEDLLALLRIRLYREDDMEVIEKAWSIVWTLTDEVPANCERFIEGGGLDVLMSCVEVFPNAAELFRRMSGVMCNVSENPHLRPVLMTQHFIQIFRKWLTSDNLDVTSHTISFLVQMAADGPEAWTVTEISRTEILQEVDEIIDKLDLSQGRGIKYRSLKPMLILIQSEDTPQAQYWGTWTIYNLIKTKAENYCQMFRKEKADEVLQKALENPCLQDKIRTIMTNMLSEVLAYFDNRSENG